MLTSPAALENNTIIFDRYKICSLLGQGGMGFVYRVHDLTEDRILALKTLIKNPEKEEKSIERFKKEFASMKALDHPAIVRAYDLYQDQASMTGFTMDWIDGKDLDSLIYSESICLELPHLVKIITDIAEGLSYAHDKKLIHRDLKPANILISRYDSRDIQAHIVDFGLAQNTFENEDLTVSSKQVGTAYYMSPEQHRGENLDALSDIYSFGILVFEMMTGKRPFDGSTPFKLFLSHVWDGIPDMRSIQADIPKWICTMVEICCEKEKKHRYQSMHEIVSLIRAKTKKPTKGFLSIFK